MSKEIKEYELVYDLMALLSSLSDEHKETVLNILAAMPDGDSLRDAGYNKLEQLGHMEWTLLGKIITEANSVKFFDLLNAVDNDDVVCLEVTMDEKAKQMVGCKTTLDFCSLYLRRWFKYNICESLEEVRFITGREYLDEIRAVCANCGAQVREVKLWH